MKKSFHANTAGDWDWQYISDQKDTVHMCVECNARILAKRLSKKLSEPMVNWCLSLLGIYPTPLPNSQSFSNLTFLLERATKVNHQHVIKVYVYVYLNRGLQWFVKNDVLANVFPPSALVQSEKHRLWLAIVWHAPRRGIGLFRNPHRFYWWYSAGTRLQKTRVSKAKGWQQAALCRILALSPYVGAAFQDAFKPS